MDPKAVRWVGVKWLTKSQFKATNSCFRPDRDLTGKQRVTRARKRRSDGENVVSDAFHCIHVQRTTSLQTASPIHVRHDDQDDELPSHLRSLLSNLMEIESRVTRNSIQFSTARPSSESGHLRATSEQRSSLRELFGQEQSLNGNGGGSMPGLSREASTKELVEIFRHFISAASEWVGSLVSLMGEEIALDDKVLMLKVRTW